ncbi:DUF4279 domain-containing protein [Janthinobacterium sp. 17J80-10]|uniref:DUF4279 domain-containing protein n=1 Tax=Janthinobacterium sp. 17J80-10 TaxID=2497863 RepID=UPI00100593BB|nr:DUF4279 domain-containing protein [Janthinobacterium sp. 17J80-10]QAU35693.1 DUF4279 domain-containing protein [Janthinobacterium sp. 17J80-10]
MGIADHSIVAFRIFGDDLVPTEITDLLGSEPTVAYSKGDERIGRKTGNRYIEKTGRWSLSAEDKHPEDIPAQITELLSKLTQDLAVWDQLRSKYAMDFFCGVFMGSSNDGLEFSPEVLGQLSARGITLSLDIYDHSDD